MDNGAVNYEGSDYFPMISTVKGNNYGEYGKDFLKAITAEAHKRGMKVVLDAVFNHTGNDSKYFNEYG